MAEDLKAAAFNYWQMGLAVVPMKLTYDEEKKKWNKKPLHNWDKWQKEKQTLEEFESFDWQNIEAFAVLLGKTKDGLYLCCIDIDKKDFDYKLLRTTKFERSIGGGIHAFYLSRYPVEGVKRHDLSIELLGMHNLVLVAPSKGYIKINDNEPTIVENATTIFYELIAKIGGELKPEAEKQVETEGFEAEVLQKWLSQIKQKLNVAGENDKYVYVHCPFHKPDKNPSFAIHKLKFYAIDYHDGNVYSLKKLAEKLGVELEGVKEGLIEVEGLNVKPLLNSHWLSLHPALDFKDGKAYVGVDLPCEVYDKKGGVSLQNMHFLITSDGKQILCHQQVLAKEKINLAHRVVKLPLRWSLKGIKGWFEGAKEVEPKEVYIAVKSIFENFMEFEDAETYDFFTLWSIGTYFFPLFESYPYLYIGGIKQVGKTKLLTLLSHICFNAIFSGDMSTPSLFRLIQSGRCTVLIDETEKLSNPDKAEDFRNLLLNGYKRGGVVYRTNKDTGQPEAFEAYSPKAVANIRGLEDVLEDRCIVFILKRGKNSKLTNSEPKFESPLWQQIRDMLYPFILQAFSELSEFSEVSELFWREAFLGRNLELWKPILVLAKYFNQWFNGLYDKMLNFASKKIEEKLVENVTEVGELLLVQTLMNIVNEEGYYKVKAVKEEMEKLFDEPQKWLTTRWVGNALRRLGFQDKRRVGTGYEYRLNAKIVEDLAERLKIPNPPSQESSPPSLSSLSSLIKENFEAVFDALVKASEGRGGAFIDEIVSFSRLPKETVQNVLKALEREGRVYSPYPKFWKVT